MYNWTFWKHFWNIWNFILLLGEDDSALKVAQQIKFHGLVGCKAFAYKKNKKCDIMNQKNSISFWGDPKNWTLFQKSSLIWK